MKFQSLRNLEFFLLHNGVTERDLSHLWPILTLCRTHMPLHKGIFPDTEDIMQFLAAYSRNLSHVERLLHYLFFFSIFWEFCLCTASCPLYYVTPAVQQTSAPARLNGTRFSSRAYYAMGVNACSSKVPVCYSQEQYLEILGTGSLWSSAAMS